MKCLSLRASWAHAVIHLGKDVENRTWKTKLRGRILIHASAAHDHEVYNDTCAAAFRALGCEKMPKEWDLAYGGIIGSVEIVDCVSHYPSHWWIGPNGFVLARPQPLKFTPYKGRLGFFDVPSYEIKKNGEV